MKTFNSKIGLVAALENESISLAKKLGNPISLKSKSGIDVLLFSYNGLSVYYILSGIGQTSATLACSILYLEFDVSFIINFGLCGSLSDNYKKNNFSIVEKIVPFQYSLDSANEASWGKIKDFSTNYLDISNYVPKNLHSLIKDCLFSTIASGDVFVSDSNLKNFLVSKFSADICDMESFGIFTACSKFSIPFLLIKCVSDNADEKANDDFTEKINKGVAEYVSFVLSIISAFVK